MPFYFINKNIINQYTNNPNKSTEFKYIIISETNDTNLYLIYVTGNIETFTTLFTSVVLTDESNIDYNWKQLCFSGSVSNTIKDMDTLINGIKYTKTVEIDVMYRNTIKAGYLSTYGIRVDCTDADIAYWYTGLQVYTKNNQTIVSIRDYNDDWHTNIPIATFEAIYNEQVIYASTTWTKKCMLQDSIKNATTIDNIISVEW